VSAGGSVSGVLTDVRREKSELLIVFVISLTTMTCGGLRRLCVSGLPRVSGLGLYTCLGFSLIFL